MHTVQNPIKSYYPGFPGGAVVESPPANAGDMGSCPGPGRSHMPWAMAAEPARPEPVLRKGRGYNSERPTYRGKKKKMSWIR